MLIQPIPISPTSPTFTSTAFTSTTFTPTAFTSAFTPTAFTSTTFTSTTFIGSPTALIAIARTSRDGDGDRYKYRDMDRDMYGDAVIPPPILLPRLLAFEDRMEVDDDDVFHDDHNEAVHDVDVHDAVDVDSSDSDLDSSDSESTTSSTSSHISDISSMTSVSSVSSSSSIAKSSPATAGVVYVPPHKHSFTKSASEPESDFDSGGSIPSHRLLSHSRSHSQHSSKSQPIPKSQSQSKSQSKSPTHVNRYKYQGGETGVMTGGVMLGSAIRSPLARPTKRGTARTLILGPDSSSSLDWRRPRVASVPGLLV